MLAGDVLDFASMLPEVHHKLTQEIMGQLQDQAERHGVTPSHLLEVPSLRHPLDTTIDGFITPTDALLVINELNEGSARSNAEEMAGLLGSHDVDRDGIVSPVDVLWVINGLNEGRYAHGHWWDTSGELNNAIVETLEHVQTILADQGLEQAADEVARISDLVFEHIKAVRQEVTAHFDERGYEFHSEGLLGFLSDIEKQLRDHLVFVHDQISQHLEYVDGAFYRDVAPNGELSPAQVDQVLDQILHDRHPEYEAPNDGTVAWHADYIRDLIDQHRGLVLEDQDLGQIREQIDSHVDYIVYLLDVHGVNVPDLNHVGEVLSHVHHIVDWVDDLADGQHPTEPLDVPYVPASVQNHLDSVWSHVGYVRDLISLHHGQADNHDDWRTVIASHVGYVRDLLRLHGLLDGGILDAFRR
jgi:hypothetical protein